MAFGKGGGVRFEGSWTPSRRVLLGLALALFAAQAFHGLLTSTGTCDELGAHLPSGILHWKSGRSTGGLADGNVYIGDINLDPEVSHQVELALNMATSNAYFEPRIFYRDVSDYIQGVPATNPDALALNPNTLQFANVDATFYGADAAWGYSIDNHWSLGGIISYVRGKRDDISDDLYRIAPLNGTLGLNYDAGSWDVTAEGVFYDSQDKVSATNSESPSSGYALMNLYGKYRVKKNVSLSGGVGNVFDRGFAPHVTGVNRAGGSDVAIGERVPGDGRNFYLAMRLDW